MIEYYEDGMTKARLANEKMQESQGVRFAGRSFNNFRNGFQDDAFKACLQYAKNFEQIWRGGRNSLLLTGSNGTGKTHLAVATMNEVIAIGGFTATFDTFAGILDTIKRSFGSDDDALQKYLNVDLLVIDDLGQEKYSEWANEIYFKIVNTRYEKQIPTIITTNLTAQELKTRNKAAFSRIQEAYRFLKMDGEDYRQRI